MVVPCCVFSRASPHRRLRDGTPVVEHPEFCAYLLEKEGRPPGASGRTLISRAELSLLEGRNIIVWGRPSSDEEGDAMPVGDQSRLHVTASA